MSKIKQVQLVGAVFAVAMTLLGTMPATAQETDYPSKPITMYVGYKAGGQTDLVGRATARVLSEQLGVPVNVVNKPGAGGAVAARTLQKDAADGYTVLFQSNSVINTEPHLMKRVSFTPDDFEYAGMITAYQVGLATQKDAPFDTLAEFVDWARENPGFSYGALSPASRMYMEEIARQNDLDANIVPLKGGGDMINAILGEQVVLALSGGIHKKYPDQMKMIAALTTFRHPSDPEVETIDEAGYALAMDSRTALILPKGTPRPVLDRLAGALEAAVEDEKFNQVVSAVFIPIMYKGVDAARAEMEQTYTANKVIFENAGVTPK
ncbi:Bug family tripartite tricarboxylate transporter substrate binding protein [Pseudooceanicola aestuarii]|uniref:Bug family tripartite tricarboxylate transporter substrate binding protein n=1 Tax=Pseudooceanicola aestuarii TaxID=2697319 RepID=UPI0013D78B67|nr:tripartite tricarboxylate transporter substrate binding protein [Pseudooceanicola aestuarii]